MVGGISLIWAIPNFGWEKGIRIGDLGDLKEEQAWVVHFVPQHDADIGPGLEFLGVDFAGNIYAGEINRERLVRYVPFRPLDVGRGRSRR